MGDTFPLILLAAMMLLFWVIVIRPQRKQQQQVAALQGGLQVGDRVMISSGIFGTVQSLGDESVLLEIAPGTVVDVVRQAVIRKVEVGLPEDQAPQGE
ncbi:hypothetical protein GCM10027425_12840 [Alteromonas gracilis]